MPPRLSHRGCVCPLDPVIVAAVQDFGHYHRVERGEPVRASPECVPRNDPSNQSLKGARHSQGVSEPIRHLDRHPAGHSGAGEDDVAIRGSVVAETANKLTTGHQKRPSTVENEPDNRVGVLPIPRDDDRLRRRILHPFEFGIARRTQVRQPGDPDLEQYIRQYSISGILIASPIPTATDGVGQPVAGSGSGRKFRCRELREPFFGKGI